METIEMAMEFVLRFDWQLSRVFYLDRVKDFAMNMNHTGNIYIHRIVAK